LLVESVADYAIFMLDPNGIVESWNVGAQRLKGYLESEIVGQHYSTFYTGEARDEGVPDRLLSDALRYGRAQTQGWRVRKDGTRFWAQVVITALFDESGEHTGFAKVTRDMTEARAIEVAREQALADQRLAVARLEELDAWRRDFITSVVHDLQNPVMAITGFAELLRDASSGTDAGAGEYVERVLSNARSLQELIDNLRGSTLLEQGRVELQLGRVDLRTFMLDLAADLLPLLGDNDLEIEVDDLVVRADPHALDRVLRNLLTNAVSHTPAGTSIRVRARASDLGVVIEVQDDGEGIPEELYTTLFERFERHSGSIGSGLGLSIAREYVELHGGTIGVDSVPGEGTTFRFTLPGYGAAGTAATPSDAAVGSS
jgi:PAS domain S-box-containing protein